MLWFAFGSAEIRFLTRRPTILSDVFMFFLRLDKNVGIMHIRDRLISDHSLIYPSRPPSPSTIRNLHG
jgi:hypothetical protein